ncbi:hypothetical protein ABI59_22590 [Acidobacteria bacterium Mor1]|nr:hypothetical protein ABI59_22590 [Acidobacteria bacterium Mor1]
MRTSRQDGYALVTVLLLLALIAALLLGYFSLTAIDTATTHSSMESVRGFYAAEAGLNIRSDLVRTVFQNYSLPKGTPPDPAGLDPMCEGSNLGSGDFACADYQLDGRTITTHINELPDSPRSIVVPRGEPHQNLSALEYRHMINSTTFNTDGNKEAELELRVNTRLVPLFQFAVFFNKDLEITPGPAMALNGPVHTNGDLYMAAYTSVDINGQVSAAGDIYRGRKEADICWTGPFRVADPSTLTEVPTCSGSRRLITQSDVTGWNGMIQTGADIVDVPQPDALDPSAGRLYWDRADLRVMLDATTNGIELQSAAGATHAQNATLAGCGALSTSNSFYNNRESKNIRMLDVDVQSLLNCLHNNTAIMGKDIDDTSDGGLVFYFGVEGPNQDTINGYGVRLQNADELASNVSLAPAIEGLTVVTNQAMYVQGHYNRTNKKPASILSDSMNVLSTAWADSDSTQALSHSSRNAATTTVNAAFLSGTDTTGGVDGSAGQDSGSYSGGVHNYPRMHEDWSGVTLTYRGSLVSLNKPIRVNGQLIVGSPQYNPPVRDFHYDTDFNTPSNLPPLSPRLTYLKQDMYVRKFEP